MTPLKLAILSIVIGIFPFCIMLLGIGWAKLMGCEVSAAGAKGCICCGRDVSKIVYSMFMFYWLTIITGGIAVFGVSGSVIWAFFR
ncbi:MAG: hypothetical protein PVG75_00610 [Thioalkalispiraceae bacterium]|jgi:hypothetical protein